MLTDDNSMAESEKSDINLTYPDEKEDVNDKQETKDAPMEIGKVIFF
jgi:hypothetical protein